MFNDFIKTPNHRYPIDFSENDFILKKYSLNSTKYLNSVEDLKFGIIS